MQARMPNPFYAQATLAAKVKICFIKFNKQLNVEIGDKCKFIKNSSTEDELGIEVITDVTPFDGAEKVQSDSPVKVSFGLGDKEKFEVPHLSGSGKDIYELKFKSYTLQTKDNDVIPAETTWTTSSELLIEPYNLWFSNDTVKFIVYVDVYKNNTLFKAVSDTTIFTTESAPDHIPSTLVNYSYPYDGMVNFYKEEFNQYKGLIELRQGLPELFYGIPDDMDQKMKLTSANGNVIVFDYLYQPIENKIVFPLDPAWLAEQKGYMLEIVRFPKGKYPTTKPSKGADFSAYSSNLGNNPFNVDTKPSSDGEQIEKSLFKIFFRVSKYTSFWHKMDMIIGTNSGINTGKIIDEDFDFVEFEDQMLFTLNLGSNEPLYDPYIDLIHVAIHYKNYDVTIYENTCDGFDMPEPNLHSILDFNKDQLIVGESNYKTVSSFYDGKQQFTAVMLNDNISKNARFLSMYLKTCYQSALDQVPEGDGGKITLEEITAPLYLKNIMISNIPIATQKISSIQVKYTLPDGTVTSTRQIQLKL